MKRTTKIAAALGIALSAALAATASLAHPFDDGYGPGMGRGPGHMMRYGMGPGAGMGPGYGRGPGYGPGGAAGPGAFVEGRLAALKSELKITPAQEGTWNAYAEQAKKQADAMRALHTQMRETTAATLPERLELRNQMWKQREAQSEATREKVKDLYAALSAEQKSIADQRLGGFGAGMHAGPGYRSR